MQCYDTRRDRLPRKHETDGTGPPVMKDGKRFIPLLLTAALAAFAAAELTAHVVSVSLVRNLNALEMRSMRSVSGEILRIASDSFHNLLDSGKAGDPAGEEIARWDALERIHRHRAMEGASVLHVAVVNERNQVLADYSRLLAGSDIPSLSGLLTESEFSFHDGEGNALLAHHRYFPDWRWHILSIAREEDLAGETKRIRALLFGSAIASLLALLFLMYLLFRFLVRNPLKDLVRSMHRLPGGYDGPVPESGCGVTREIAGAYNRMTEIIRQRQQELSDLAELTEDNPNLVMKVARDGRILYANRAVEHALHTLDLPIQHYELLLPDDLETIVEQVLSGGERNRWVIWKMRGRVIDYSVSVLGQEEEVLFHGVDVTDKITREEQLLHYQTMETWKKIVSVAAHDLHRLLTGILGNASALKRRRIEDPCSTDAITGIENAATEGLPLTRRLLGFGRKGSREFRHVDMNRMVDETVGIMIRTLPKKIEIRVEKEEGLPFVSGDRTRLQQCLINLCTIVGEMMNGVGGLSITTRTLLLESNRQEMFFRIPEGSYVLVAVEGRSRGMGARSPLQPYDPFHSASGENQGSGPAMKIVNGIVEDHNGFITALSLPGEGAGLHMVLPAGVTLSSTDKRKERREGKCTARTGEISPG